jgi:uncharacterized protein DUF3226
VAPAQIPPLEKDYLIVGEGAGDAKFLRYLCDLHDLHDFQIEDVGGTSKFLSYFKGLSIRPNFERLKAILIVRDNDDSWENSFGELRKYLKKANLPEPTQPRQIKRFDHTPDGLAVVVLMIPFTVAGGETRGSLDTLLLRPIEENNAEVAACVGTFLACVNRPRTKNEVDKFRLRCSVAALYPQDPNCAIQYVLSPDKNLVPLTHSCFEEIVAFLKGFVGFCAPPPRRR